MNEAELIQCCIDKDRKAWGLFVEKYSRLVYWAVRRRLAAGGFSGDEADVEDIFQEVFLAVLKEDRLRQLKDAKFIPGWLAMVAANKTVDFMRQKIRRPQNVVFNSSLFKDDTFRDELFSRDTMAVVGEVINTLSDKERIIISLNLLEGMTHKETAQIAGIPVNTASTIIARAKEKLKIELKKRGISENFLKK